MRYDCTDCDWFITDETDQITTNIVDLVVDHHVDRGHSIERTRP